MLYRTLKEAVRHKRAESWIHVQILRCIVQGRTYFRTYEFDSTKHKCKRCRKAKPGDQRRVAATNRTCEICGNPFGGFVRELRHKFAGGWATIHGAWTDSGRLH